MTDAKGCLLPALVSVALIAAILYFVDIPKVITTMRLADYCLLGLVLIAAFSWMFVRGLVWRTLLRDRTSYRNVLLSLGEGYLLNNFLPFRLGELGRAFLLSRKSDLPFVEILPTIVIERATDLAYSAAVLLAALPFVVGASGANRVAIVAGAAVILLMLTLFVLVRNRRGALEVFHRLSGRWPALRRWGGAVLEPLFEGLTVLTDAWVFGRFLLWMTINWAIALVTYYLIIRAFFPQAQLVWGLFGLGAAAFGGAVPSLPGAVGTFEGALGRP